MLDHVYHIFATASSSAVNGLFRVGEWLWGRPVVRRVVQVVAVLALCVFLFYLIALTSVLTYSIFYYLYVPTPEHSWPLYFDFSGHVRKEPFTFLPLTSEKRLFYRNQGYSFFIELDLPDNPQNHDVGMFMVSLSLHESREAAFLGLGPVPAHMPGAFASTQGFILSNNIEQYDKTLEPISPRPSSLPRKPPNPSSLPKSCLALSPKDPNCNSEELLSSTTEAPEHSEAKYSKGADTIHHVPEPEPHGEELPSSLPPPRYVAITRPAMLTYRSAFVQTLHTALVAIPAVLGLTSETQHLTIPLFDNVYDSRTFPYSWASVTLSSPRLQVYSAKLHVFANLTGLSYFMYYWFFTSAVTGIMFTIFLQSSFVVFLVLVYFCWCRAPSEEDEPEDYPPTYERQRHDEPRSADSSREPEGRSEHRDTPIVSGHPMPLGIPLSSDPHELSVPSSPPRLSPRLVIEGMGDDGPPSRTMSHETDTTEEPSPSDTPSTPLIRRHDEHSVLEAEGLDGSSDERAL